MEYASIVFNQLLIMFIYMMVGFILHKTKLLDESGAKSLSNLLIYAVMPCVIIRPFLMAFTVEGLKILGEGLLAAIVALGSGAIICLLLFNKDVLTRVGTTFPNAGFIGIPLITVALGVDAVFYLIPLQLMICFFQYTYSSLSFSKTKVGLLKGIVLNPMFISICIGFIIYITRLGDKLPSVLSNTINGLYSIQSPLAMIITGTYLAKVNFKHLHVKKDLFASLVRLVIIPLCVFALFKLLPINEMTKTVMMIGVSCSIGSNIAVYAAKFGGDYVYACEVVSFSTILSIATLPLVMMFLV